MNSMSTRLDECCQIELSSIDKKSKENEKEVYLCNFTDVYYNWNIYSSMKNTFMKATASDNNISIFSLKAGDVVITKDSETRDDIGIPAYIYDDLNNTVLGYHCALIRPTKNILGSYLNAYLSSYLGRKHFSNQASGSGQRYTLTKESLGSISIPLIDKKQQMFIGSLFNNIDKKISLNNKIISELESMAKTIYDYWFLQFEFPNEEGKPYKSSGGKMVWNEELKREIPEGWEVKNIFNVADIIYGFPLSVEKFNKNGNIPVIRIRDIISNSISAYTNELFDEKYLTKEGDLLIGMDGNFQMNFWFRDGDCVNQRITRIREIDYPNYLIMLQIKPFIEKKVDSVARSTVGHLSDKDMKSLKILIPNNFGIYTPFKSILNKQLLVTKENQELTSLRDFLLPLLMNGQVGFKNETK